MNSSLRKFVIIPMVSIACFSSLKGQKGNTTITSTALEGGIQFLNGDNISGSILSWNDKTITIASADLLNPVSFSTANVLNVSINGKNINNDTAFNSIDETLLRVNHRDNEIGQHGLIKGSFTDIDDKYISLDTKYAGKIKVLKKFITRIDIDNREGYTYKGPNSFNEWFSHDMKPSWKFAHRSLIGGNEQGNISKDVKTPDKAILSFDLLWKESDNISFYLYSSDHEMRLPDNFYRLRIHRGMVSMEKMMDGRNRSSKLIREKKPRDFNRFLKIRRFNKFNRQRNITQHTSSKYTIYMNKAKGEFHIYRNGKKVSKYTDKSPSLKKYGTALHLVAKEKNPVRVKNLSVSRWTGSLPVKPNKKKIKEITGEGEHIILANGDLLVGKISKIKDKVIEIKTPYTPLKIPLNRMSTIEIATNNRVEEPIKYLGDFKCWYQDKGWIILKPISITGNTLTAFHQAIGKKQYNLNEFKRIDFNIYNRKPKANRKTINW